MSNCRLEAARHCRWVDEIVAEAPWVIDEAFLKKYEIDYVAHDEDAYASAGHDDVYGYVKSQGVSPAYFFTATRIFSAHLSPSPFSERTGFHLRV